MSMITPAFRSMEEIDNDNTLVPTGDRPEAGEEIKDALNPEIENEIHGNDEGTMNWKFCDTPDTTDEIKDALNPEIENEIHGNDEGTMRWSFEEADASEEIKDAVNPEDESAGSDTAPVSDPEEQVVIEKEINDAEKQADTYAEKMKMGIIYLSELQSLHDYVKEHGVDRAFLRMHNKNDQLTNILRMYFPSCESFDEEGDPNSRISIAALEAIETASQQILKALRDQLMLEYSAIRRFVQALFNDAKKTRSKLIVLKDQIRRVRSLPHKEIKAYSNQELQQWIRMDAQKKRMFAFDAIRDMQDWDFQEGHSKEGADVAAKLEEQIHEIERNEPTSMKIDVASFGNPANIARLIDYAISALTNIEKTDADYAGFWQTGFNQGKLVAILGGAVGEAIILELRKNVIRVARTSWRNMNTLSRIDRDVAHAIVRIAKAAIDQ